MITVLHRGGGVSRDPQKWLHNLRPTPNEDGEDDMIKMTNIGIKKTHQSAESTTNIIPSVARVYDRQSGRTYVFKVDS